MARGAFDYDDIRRVLNHDRMDKDNQKPMVHVEHLKKYFPVRKRGFLKAVDDVSLRHLRRGDPGAGGGVGMRQDDLRTNRCKEAVSGHLGTIEFAGRDVRQLKTNDEIKWFKKERPDHLPGSLASLDPRNDGGRHRGGGNEEP